MSRKRCARVSVVLVALAGLIAVPSDAIVIRHDVDDSLYIDNGAQYKYEAAGLVNGGTTCPFAGGVVIHPEWILTAAHCVPPSTAGQTVKFNLGASTTALETTVTADDWFRHSSYSGNVAAGNDFALIHLPEPVLDVTPTRLYRGAGEIGQTATIVGYGITGTGLTGATGPLGTRRGGEFTIDAFGGAIGASGFMALGDFDNPDDPSDSTLGSPVPLPLEAAVALWDSGSPWFIDINGLTYAAGISSFIAEADGNANSDYGDITGGTRTSRQITWINSNHDQSVFWNGTTGDWGQDSRWVNSPQPTAVNAAVIDFGHAIISAAGEEAEYVFVDGTGKLDVGNTFDVTNINVNRQGTLSPLGNVALTTDVRMFAGTLEFSLGASDQFEITGNVEVAGELAFKADGYNDPANRGDFNTFTLLVASDLQGSFDSIDYEGSTIEEGTNYVGSNQNGDDGLFRIVNVDESGSNDIELINYLALPGDANGDLIVDGLDFIIWNENKFSAGTDWSTGDFTGDGTTDGLDYIEWNKFKFTSVNLAAASISATPVGVPEPVGAVMIWTGLAGLATCRRKIVRA